MLHNPAGHIHPGAGRDRRHEGVGIDFADKRAVRPVQQIHSGEIEAEQPAAADRQRRPMYWPHCPR